MSDENGFVAGSIFPGTETPEENITHAPNAIGPNFEIAVAPVGLLRVAFSAGVLMSSFYCDSEAARIISTQFGEMADKLDTAHEEMRTLVEKEEITLDTAEEDDAIQEAEVVEVVEDDDKFSEALKVTT